MKAVGGRASLRRMAGRSERNQVCDDSRKAVFGWDSVRDVVAIEL